MSLRTTPLSASAFGPLEPSPGNGPAVSSGIEEARSSVVAVAACSLAATRGERRGQPAADHAERAAPVQPRKIVSEAEVVLFSHALTEAADCVRRLRGS